MARTIDSLESLNMSLKTVGAITLKPVKMCSLSQKVEWILDIQKWVDCEAMTDFMWLELSVGLTKSTGETKSSRLNFRQNLTKLHYLENRRAISSIRFSNTDLKLP